MLLVRLGYHFQKVIATSMRWRVDLFIKKANLVNVIICLSSSNMIWPKVITLSETYYVCLSMPLRVDQLTKPQLSEWQMVQIISIGSKLLLQLKKPSSILAEKQEKMLFLTWLYPKKRVRSRCYVRQFFLRQLFWFSSTMQE